MQKILFQKDIEAFMALEPRLRKAVISWLFSALSRMKADGDPIHQPLSLATLALDALHHEAKEESAELGIVRRIQDR